MFRSKKDVDAHVRDVFSKCTAENERLKLCFGIAKQYAGIREFDTARRYLDTYLASNPANMAEAQKLMGDVHLELGDSEKALDSYKVSYTYGKGRDSLNRVCDLLSRGYGASETTESKKQWLDLQKTSANNNCFTPTSSSPAMPKRTQTPVGPPKTGFSHTSFTNGNSSPLVSSASKPGGNVDLQLRYLERRFDDGLGKILDQNTMVLEQMLRLKEDIKDLSEKMEQIALTQQQMQTDMKEIQDKENTAALTAQLNKLNTLSNHATPKCMCEDRSRELKAELNSLSSTVKSEYANLKGCMERLENLTVSAIDNYHKDVELRNTQQTVTVKTEPQLSAVLSPSAGNLNALLKTPIQQQQPQFNAQSTDLSMWRSAPSAEFAEQRPLSELVKTPEGNWNCVTCKVNNTNDKTTCVACGSSRVGFGGSNTRTESALPIVQPKFNFSFQPSTPTLNFGINNSNATSSPIPGLTTMPASANSTSGDSNTVKKSDESKGSPFIGLNLTGKISFTDLAQNNNSSFTFGSGNTETPSFAGTGSPLFSSLTMGNKSSAEEQKTAHVNPIANTSTNAEEGDDDFVPTAEFEPVIPLPPLVEVKKGDENENTIAEYRAKLYRFVTETKEWKERGIGNIKLLQAKDDPKKCRVVMWREKVGKLACNFNLFPDIIVTHYQNSPKVLCWKCQDFAEDSAWETFTLKFGNEDNCANFKQEMERLAKLTNAPSDSPKKADSTTPSTPAQQSVNSTGSVTSSANVPLSQLFKQPEGNWNCEACYCSNGKDVTVCPACQTCRPGFEKEEPKPVVLPQSTFSFGFPSAKPITPPTLSFGINNSAATVVDGSTPKKSDENKDSPFPGLNLSGKFSFADLAKNNTSSFGELVQSSNPNFTFGGSGDTPSFAGAGAPLFSALNLGNKNNSEEQKTSQENSNNANTSTNADDGEDDFVPTVEFQPVIPLPPLVEVKKGDENENTIVEYRAKLYRFVTETKEWKERGIGNIKLLQSKDDPRRCRVVMWREKVGKLACNFNLFPDIILTNYQNSPKVLCWKCQDFAEDTAWETFTLKFGNEDNCAHFKKEMERLAALTNAPSDSPKKDEKNDTSQTPTSTSQTNGPTGGNSSNTTEVNTTQVPLSQLFKQPEGNWNCEACYCSNGKDVTVCVACQTCRPGFENVAREEPPPVQPTFSFGFPSAKPITPPTLSFGINNNATGTGPTPPVTSDDNTPKRPDENKDSPFGGLNLSGKFSFADLGNKSNTSSFGDLAKSNNQSFSFGGGSGDTPSFAGAGAPLFASMSFGNKSSTDQKTSKENSNVNTSANADDGEDDFVPTVEFQPVIPLPPLVEVKKGDENENMIIEYRAKLYRFAAETKEWKERGIGNIKLLQSKDDPNKCRVVMWREKIGKLACNFNLYPDIKLTNYQNNPKVLCWKCQDFAEGEAWETFTLRFSNEDNCEDFKNKLMQYATGSGSPVSTVSSTQPEASSCPGCIGCNVDAFQFPERKHDDEEATIDIPLTADVSAVTPVIVSPNYFDQTDNVPKGKEVNSVGHEPEVEVKNDISIKENNVSSFSFSLPTETPEKNSNPISFQFKSPNFSFKSPEGTSPSIFGGVGGGSIFTPPQLSSASSNAASPFVSPFAQPPAGNNDSASSHPSPFGFSQSPFQPNVDPLNASTNNEGDNQEHQEEDEYEDVDDEDECMFEDDAHVFIQDDADSSEGFSDRGEGVVRVLYDGESYCARLVIIVEEETIAEHLVAVETLLEPKGDKTYEWIGVCNYESPTKSRIKVTFSNDEAYENFSSVMADGLEFAEQAGITENVLMDDSGY